MMQKKQYKTTEGKQMKRKIKPNEKYINQRNNKIITNQKELLHK